MAFEYSDRSGTVFIENQGAQTNLQVSSGSGGQQQSQGNGFTTGEWSSDPELYRDGRDLLLVLHTPEGDRAVRIHGSSSQSLSSVPETSGCERLELKQVEKSSHQGKAPMKPMEPMRPMKPMKPMEMRMGNMHMSMGSGMEMRMGDMHLKMGEDQPKYPPIELGGAGK